MQARHKYISAVYCSVFRLRSSVLELNFYLGVGLLVAGYSPMADLTLNLSARDRRYEKYFNDGDADGIVSMYTEDCRWMQPDKNTQIGRDAVKQFLNGVMAAGAKSLILDMDECGPLGGADMVYSRSPYTFLKDDGSLFAKGKLVIIWKKVDGVYHLYTKIFNSSPA